MPSLALEWYRKLVEFGGSESNDKIWGRDNISKNYIETHKYNIDLILYC